MLHQSQIDLKKAEEKLVDLDERVELRRKANASKESELKIREDALEKVKMMCLVTRVITTRVKCRRCITYSWDTWPAAAKTRAIDLPKDSLELHHGLVRIEISALLLQIVLFLFSLNVGFCLQEITEEERRHVRQADAMAAFRVVEHDDVAAQYGKEEADATVAKMRTRLEKLKSIKARDDLCSIEICKSCSISLPPPACIFPFTLASETSIKSCIFFMIFSHCTGRPSRRDAPRRLY